MSKMRAKRVTEPKPVCACAPNVTGEACEKCYAPFPVTEPSAAPQHSADIDAMRQWQPIETAPKDGTIVLLWGTYGSMMCANSKPIVGWFSRGWWTERMTLSHVTHWMPLPDAPVAAIDAALQAKGVAE